ncbi:MAG: CNNM domain-containing protein, partial [Haloarculaceae archaeon]
MVGILAWTGLLAGLVLLLANGSFVTMEYALTRLRQFPESDFSSEALRRAWEMTEELEIYLSASKLGIAITSIGLGVVAEPALAAVLDPGLRTLGLVGTTTHAGHTALASTLAFAVITFLHVTVGEQAPTYLGVERPKPVARYGSPGLRLWTRIMGPVIRFGDRIAKAAIGLVGVELTRSWVEAEAEESVSQAELRREMGEVLERSELTEERREEVLDTLAIDDTTVGEVMVPADEAVALSADDDVERTLDRVRESPHTRYPLLDPDADLDDLALADVVGTVYTSALFRDLEALRSGERDLADVAVEPMTV